MTQVAHSIDAILLLDQTRGHGFALIESAWSRSIGRNSASPRRFVYRSEERPRRRSCLLSKRSLHSPPRRFECFPLRPLLGLSLLQRTHGAHRSLFHSVVSTETTPLVQRYAQGFLRLSRCSSRAFRSLSPSNHNHKERPPSSRCACSPASIPFTISNSQALGFSSRVSDLQRSLARPAPCNTSCAIPARGESADKEVESQNKTLKEAGSRSE